MEKFFPKNINYLKNTSDDMLHKRVADIFLYNPIKKGIVINHPLKFVPIGIVTKIIEEGLVISPSYVD